MPRLMQPGTRMRQMGPNRLGSLSGVVAPPVAPANAVFAIAAHPLYCASDADHLVPCVAGDQIRWWKEIVSGTWYEEGTGSNRYVLRSAGGGKWYAEGASGRQHLFTLPSWGGSTQGTRVIRLLEGSSGNSGAAHNTLASNGDFLRFSGDGNTYPRIFRTARMGGTALPARSDTVWKTSTVVSDASDYLVRWAGTQVGSTTASWETPTTLELGRLDNNPVSTCSFAGLAFYTSGLAGAELAAAEAWAASLA